MHAKMHEFVGDGRPHLMEGVAKIDMVSVRYNDDKTISATITDTGIEDPSNDAMFAIKDLKGYNSGGQFIKIPPFITDGNVWCPMMLSNRTTLYSRPFWHGVELNKADQLLVLEMIDVFLREHNLI